MKVEHELLLRATQPERFAQLEEAGDLDALTVMRENMVFFHVRAAEILASLMALPLGEDANADQLAGIQGLGRHVQMPRAGPAMRPRLGALHARPDGPKARVQRGKHQPEQAARARTHAQGGPDAFARIAAGLPPEPRKRL